MHTIHYLIGYTPLLLAQTLNRGGPVYRLADKELDAFIGLRQELHRQPELAFNEHQTANMVANRLKEMGYSVTQGLGVTGLVGQLVRGNEGPRIGLRADMDALPIEEASGKPWASKVNGVMHACGHDGHIAILLAAAAALAEQPDWRGTLNLMFQPAEEGAGGALAMMRDGLFEQFPCDFIFAMHNMPGIPQGKLVFRSGPTMASSYYLTVTLNGKGGHGAMPHLAADPVVAASSLVMALQTVVARNTDPLQPAVVTVGSLQAGQANNVIPAHATLEISVRTLDPALRVATKERLLSLIELHAKSMGVSADIEWRDGYAVLVNDAEQTAKALAVARKYFPANQIDSNGPMLTGSEDFAFMLEQVPGCYLFIGNGEGEMGGCMVHNPGYDFNDKNIGQGSAFWVALVCDLLSPKTFQEIT